MDYKEQAQRLRSRYLGSMAGILQNPKCVYSDCNQAAASITVLLDRAEKAEAEKQKLCEEEDHLKDLLKEAEERAKKAEIKAKVAINDLEKAMSFDYGDAIWGFLCGICDNKNCGGVCKPKWVFHEEE